jgi:large subunit ribosomal protein L22
MSKPATPRPVAANEALAVGRSIRVSPRKLGLVASFIRGMSAKDAIVQLTFLNKRVAQDVKKVVQFAVANAENNHSLDVDRLYIKEAVVGKALVMKRFHPRARGRAGKIVKPFSTIRVVVREREDKE